MGNERWHTYQLGDVTENFDSKRIPVKEAERKPGPYPYYGASGVVDHVEKFIFDGEYLLIAEDGENLRSRRLPIAFVATGQFWVNNHAHIVTGNHLANARYLGYALNAMDISGYLSGSTMPKLTQGNMDRIEVSLPPKPVQDAIVDVVMSLDGKTDLNSRMNRTLEKMAVAIFKSWFIDFDPVRAKAAGRDPGLPQDIADLFADSFEDSELGEIPKGWELGPLTKIATLQTKTVHPGERPETLWEHYSIPAFDEGRVPKWERGSTIKSGKYSVPRGSVLASKLNPQFPRVWLPEISDAAVAICSSEFMPFVPIDERWRPFLYELIKSPRVQEEIRTRVSGSTGSRQRAKPKDIAVMPVIVPGPKTITAFCGVVDRLHGKLMACRRNSLSLAGARDRLLPKLISGEIQIRQSEIPKGAAE